MQDREDQLILFELVTKIFFVGIEEFRSMYQSAMTGNIARWVSDLRGFSLQDCTNKSLFESAMKRIWCCPITDSLVISEFYHINRINFPSLRPDWRSLLILGSPDKIVAYMESKNLDSIVLLEDFVGSGNQMEKAVTLAANLPNKPNILLCPMLVCPDGFKKGKELEKLHSNLTFDPVLRLSDSILARRESSWGTESEMLFKEKLCDLIESNYEMVSGGKSNHEQEPFGPYGYASTGSLVVMSSNCPNNTIPMIHSQTKTWNALFPRSQR